ncbi:MAG: hypothetical protein JXR31_08685 [Prolixibacteraceae bacterium]|nr:hypothetical protein [Prolixibacteraceae bacterium]
MNNWLRNITSVLVLITFLFSTSGIVVYKSFCSCTGTSKISLFSSSESCTSMHKVGTASESCCSSVNEDKNLNSCCSENSYHCIVYNSECRCGSAEAQYLKLDSKIVNTVQIVTESKVKLSDSVINVENEKLVELLWRQNTFLAYIEPPPQFSDHKDYLNFICKRKIPEIA